MTETRTLLLDLGERAVRTRGFAGFSYADLARDAGIRKASIHHHFPTKADLAFALVERYSTALDQRLADITAREQTAGKQLRAAIALYRSALGDGDQMCLCAALATDASLLPEPTLKALDQTNRQTATWFAQVFASAQEDATIALGPTSSSEQEGMAALALLQGAQLLARSAASPIPFDDATTALSRRIQG